MLQYISHLLHLRKIQLIVLPVQLFKNSQFKEIGSQELLQPQVFIFLKLL